MAETNFTIIVDTREQLPFDFERFGVETVRQGLTAGDYGIVGMPVVVERKTGEDLYSCMTVGRDRFERELERLRSYEFSAVVVENLEQDLLCGMYGKMSPRSIKATLVAWLTRFGVLPYSRVGRADNLPITRKILARCSRWKAIAAGGS